MSDETLSFDQLMDRLRTGDQDAASEVFRRDARRLVALAQGRLDSRTRPKLDAEDVLQSVFRSFFSRCSDGRINLENWESMWSLLVVITLRKCGRRVEYFRAACRDVQRERAPALASEDSAAEWEAIAREPTPAEAILLTETIEQCMQPLDERERLILSLSLEGYSPPEISERVGRTERTIYRLLERVRKRLERLRATDVE